MDRTIRTVDDVLGLLDRLFAADADRWTPDASGWWDRFYADRGRPAPSRPPRPGRAGVGDGVLDDPQIVAGDRVTHLHYRVRTPGAATASAAPGQPAGHAGNDEGNQ
jgi:hypothetical protein